MEPKMNEPRLSNKICPDGMSVKNGKPSLEESAAEGNFQIEHLDSNRIWETTLSIAVRAGTGCISRGALGQNYCSCLDFRTNGLRDMQTPSSR